jgi:hypothetical protein
MTSILIYSNRVALPGEHEGRPLRIKAPPEIEVDQASLEALLKQRGFESGRYSGKLGLTSVALTFVSPSLKLVWTTINEAQERGINPHRTNAFYVAGDLAGRVDTFVNELYQLYDRLGYTHVNRSIF